MTPSACSNLFRSASSPYPSTTYDRFFFDEMPDYRFFFFLRMSRTFFEDDRFLSSSLDIFLYLILHVYMAFFLKAQQVYRDKI